MKITYNQILSLNFFQKFISKLIIPLAIISPVILAYGLWLALFASPQDYQQGEMVRIMYVHVPAAWLALAIYSLIAILSFIGLVWRIKLAYFYCLGAAPVGACMALITLVTGSIWGFPVWGSWWVWDARLTSMLILFFTYLTYIATISSGDDIMRAEKPASILAILGVINIPIVKFSVQIWYSLHQGPSIFRSGGPSIDASMMRPLIVMFIAFSALCALLTIIRTKLIIENYKLSL